MRSVFNEFGCVFIFSSAKHIINGELQSAPEMDIQATDMNDINQRGSLVRLPEDFIEGSRGTITKLSKL